jgi:hypothetical protein
MYPSVLGNSNVDEAGDGFSTSMVGCNAYRTAWHSDTGVITKAARRGSMYHIEVKNGEYLTCFTRIGDSHYTFGATTSKKQATTFDFRKLAEHALLAYQESNKDALAHLRECDDNPDWVRGY